MSCSQPRSLTELSLVNPVDLMFLELIETVAARILAAALGVAQDTTATLALLGAPE